MPVPETYSPTNDMNSIESEHKHKLYQALAFSIPICLIFILLFVCYVIYLYRRNINVNWSPLGIFGPFAFTVTNNDLSRAELGLRKDLREMLPIVIFSETFTINDPQCSVCLGDYQADEKLQQIPGCGHTFHMECIDTWLTAHTTCPLCRRSLIPKGTCRSHQTLELVSSMENSNEGEASLDRSHQRSELVSSMEISHEGGASGQPQPDSITEAVSQIDDGQEGEGDS